MKRTLWLLWVPLAFPQEGPERRLVARRDPGTITVERGDRIVLAYRYGDAPFKPYLRTLTTPGGFQILRDSPADHVHHRGVMFAVEVNRTDFWAEGARSGKQVHAGLDIDGGGVSAGFPRLRLSQKLEWAPPGEGRAVLQEERSVETYEGAALGATLVTWRSRLRAGKDLEKAVLTGSHYQGLGIRFVASMDGSERFLHAAGEPGPVVRGTERVTPSAWTAYTASAEGRPVTVALFDHPANLRHPAGMFTMFKPFSYLSATPNVWKNPYELRAGEVLDLRYGVACWDGEPDRNRVEELYGRWKDLAGP